MQTFKQYVELFIAPVFDSLTSGQQTTAAAAGEFIGQVRDQLGPNIWAGRLTPEQQQAQAASPHVPPPAGGSSFHSSTQLSFLPDWLQEQAQDSHSFAS